MALGVVYRKLIDEIVSTRLDHSTNGLSNLRSLITTVDTVADGIQADLDNAVDGLGAIKTAVDTETLQIDNTLANATYGLSAIKTKVDGVQTDLDNTTDGLGAIKTAVDTETLQIDNTLANATYGLAALDSDLSTILTAIQAVQNNTTFGANVGGGIWQRPSTGSTAVEIIVTHRDEIGNLEAPDGNMAVNITNAAGTSLNTNLYTDAALTIAATTTVETGLTGKVMSTVATGKYRLYYAVSSTATEERLTLDFNFKENTNYQSYVRDTSISDATNDLSAARSILENATYGNAALNTDLDQILVYTDILDDATNGNAAIKTKINGVQTDLDNAVDGLGALKALIDTADAAIDAVQVDLGDFSVDINLPSLKAALGIPNVAGKSLYTVLVTDRLDNTVYGLSALKTETDNIDAYLANTTYGLPQLRTELDNVDAQLGTSANAASTTTTHFAMLKHLDDDLSALVAAVGVQAATVTFRPVQGTAVGTELTDTVTEYYETYTTTSSAATDLVSYTFNTTDTGTKTVKTTFTDLNFTTQVTSGAGTGTAKWVVGSGATPTTWVDLTNDVAISATLADVTRAGAIKLAAMNTLPFTIKLVAWNSDNASTLTLKPTSGISVEVTYELA